MTGNVIQFPSERVKTGPREVREADVVTFPTVPRAEAFDLNEISVEVLQDFFTQLMMPSEPGHIDHFDDLETAEGVTIFDYGLFRPGDNK